MDSTWGFLIAAITLIVTIVQANENRKKKAEERRKASENKPVAERSIGRGRAGRTTGQSTDQAAEMWRAFRQPDEAARQTGTPAASASTSAWRPERRSLAQILEELAREASGDVSNERSSDNGAPYDGFFGAGGYEAAEYPGSESSSSRYSDIYNMEDADAEGRYVGGEMGAAAHHVGGEMRPAPRYVGGEMGAPARYTGGGTGSQDTCYTGGEATRRDAERYAGGEPAASVQSGGDETDGHMPHDTATGRLADLLGGEFDLRRAVIESEILTPKYIAKQQF